MRPAESRVSSRLTHPMQIEFGNAADVPTNGTGWFIGFSDWTKSDLSNLRHMPADLASTGLCVKWFLHEAGDPNGEPKPVSEGRTMSMLVGEPSEFRIDFSFSHAFEPGRTTTFVLRRPGDFAAWGHGIHHRAFGLRKACILTMRWVPEA